MLQATLHASRSTSFPRSLLIQVLSIVRVRVLRKQFTSHRHENKKLIGEHWSEDENGEGEEIKIGRDEQKQEKMESRRRQRDGGNCTFLSGVSYGRIYVTPDSRSKQAKRRLTMIIMADVPASKPGVVGSK